MIDWLGQALCHRVWICPKILQEVLLQHLDQNESHLVSCVLQVLLPCWRTAYSTRTKISQLNLFCMGSKPVFAVGGAWCPTEFTYSATEIHGRKLPCKAAQCMLVGKTVLPCASLAHNSFPASAVPSLIEIWPCTSTCQENREHLHVTDLPDSFDWEQKGADLWCCLNTHTHRIQEINDISHIGHYHETMKHADIFDASLLLCQDEGFCP